MNKKAFSIVELIFVIAILSVMAVSGFSVYKVWQTKSNISSSKLIVLQSLYEARENAILSVNDSDWGVKYINNNIILFSGDSYLFRDETQDKIFNLSNDIYLTNLDEIIFTKITGLPSGELNIIFNEDQDEKIEINSQGVFNN